jgi:hypothetical protein
MGDVVPLIGAPPNLAIDAAYHSARRSGVRPDQE